MRSPATGLEVAVDAGATVQRQHLQHVAKDRRVITTRRQKFKKKEKAYQVHAKTKPQRKHARVQHIIEAVKNLLLFEKTT